jgi:PIN domain nuclease of toxin-antitoxin system
MVDVLLDTTFILPTVGIAVKEISEEDLLSLKQLSKKTRLHCSHISFVELLGKIAKDRSRLDKSTVNLGIRSLIESGTYRWVNPSSEALQKAFELRFAGHKDNIDNILYSTALDSRMLFLSLDEELKDFLHENGYDTGMFVDIDGLSRRIKI